MKNNGGAAFPAVATYEDGLKSYSNEIHGMSLRDWFAGQALRLLVDQGRTVILEVTANEAYRIADVMLIEREK